MDLTTVDRVKKILVGGRSGKMSDEQNQFLGQFITAVSTEIEKLLKRHIEKIERTEKYNIDFARQQVFMIRGFPIDTNKTFEIKYDWYRNFGVDVTEMDSTYYYIDGEKGILTIDGITLSERAGALQIKYTGGMGTDVNDFIDNYADIATACALQVSFLYQRRNQLGLTGTSQEGGSVSFMSPIKLLPGVIATVMKHARIKPK